MRGWSYQSMEWSLAVSRVYSTPHHHRPSLLFRQHHVVLPDLPQVITPDLRRDFLDQVPTSKQIQTCAVNQHSRESWKALVQTRTTNNAGEYNTDSHLLVVGGNEIDGSSLLSTPEAIELALKYTPNVWAVANPNAESSVDSVHAKVQAGATGLITQPLLASQAMSILEQYPKHNNGNDGSCITYVAGLALPKTLRNLMFWLQLLEQPELEKDLLFQASYQHFEQGGSSIEWAEEQLAMLAQVDLLSGVHFMPLQNTQDLLSILRLNNKQ